MENFHKMTTPLPLWGVAKPTSSQKKDKPKDLIENLADPEVEEEDPNSKSKEKFAGLMPGSTIWKYNPNSEYNKLNDKRPGVKEEYQD